MRFWREWSLLVRLTATITGIVIVVIMIVTLVDSQRVRLAFQNELEQQAILLLDTLDAGSADSLYFLDADYLSDLMLNLGENRVIIFGQIYDNEGRVVADALDPDTRFEVAPDAYGQLLLDSEEPIFDWTESELRAGQRVQLGNQTVGAISVGLPTDPLSERLADIRVQGFYVALLAIGMGMLMALLVSRTITDPLYAMMEATQNLSAGDLSSRVTVESGDELAILGNHFNQMAAQLETTLVQMEQQIAELDAFAHTVAHDLKGPLSFINGMTEVLSSRRPQLDEADLDKYLARLNHSSLKAVGIVDELLLLSSVRREEVEPVLLDMAPIVESALDRLNYMVDDYQAKVIVADSWPAGLGYGPWVEEVWVNYLSNALKYGGHPPRVVLGGEMTPEGTARFWVRDNGPGISPERQELLFTEFVRLNQVRIEGFGLGLSIVRRIGDKLGGTVGVESREGYGSTFWFTLPAAGSRHN